MMVVVTGEEYFVDKFLKIHLELQYTIHYLPCSSASSIRQDQSRDHVHRHQLLE